MNKRIEDQLAKLAFGELSTSEEAELRRLCESDPEAGKTLEQFQSIRHGLKQLPVTPHQLSTERLNEAILRQGLRSPAEPSLWRWLSAPTWAAAAVLAIWGSWSVYSAGPVESGLTAKPLAARSNLSKGPSGSSGMNSNLESALAQAELSAPDQGAIESAHVEPMKVAKAAPPPPISTEKSVRVAKREPSAPADLVYAADQLSIDVIENAIVSSAAFAASPDDSEPLVIIDEARDETTGASRAKEVTSVSNVVVGG